MGIITSSTGRAQRVTQVDSQHPSPDRRAQYLYARLQELQPQPTMWDMVCLATEIINITGLMEPAFSDISKKLSAITYESHYIHGTDLTSCLSNTTSLNSESQTSPAAQTSVEPE